MNSYGQTQKMLGLCHSERKSNEKTRQYAHIRLPKIFLYDYTHGKSEGVGRLTSDRPMKVQIGPAFGAESIKVRIFQSFDPEAVLQGAGLSDVLAKM